MSWATGNRTGKIRLLRMDRPFLQKLLAPISLSGVGPWLGQLRCELYKLAPISKLRFLSQQKSNLVGTYPLNRIFAAMKFSTARSVLYCTVLSFDRYQLIV